jgi:cytochrome c oxidase subunit II
MSEHHETPHESPAKETTSDGAGVTAETLHVDRYESAWMRLSFTVLVIFFIAITISAFSAGFQLPGVYQRIDPASLLNEGSPFANPQVRELSPGNYEVHIRAQIWLFTPGEIRIPAGSKVKFYVTSMDVQHGIKILKTNINMMVLPGQVSTLSATFNEPGTYQFVCHEYCGAAHHTMYGQIIVEEPSEEMSASATYPFNPFSRLVANFVQ